LGTPGLINAYKTATALALQLTPVIQKQVEVNYNLQFNYTQMNEVMTLLKQYQCNIIRQEMQLFCAITTGIPKRSLQDVVYHLKELQNITVEKITA
jgi:putative IMPACT (imprinted ancient) family translation regulator